ncbi:hypothetical protein [Oerskovia flava]|uniref:hypothetical protein n=1 Tax=Oerskovia flava TaxID=2986422 RepID=UPI00223F5218|nr:hypothetical protein [Oerskovia sp. JB1-3-2]
MAAPMPPTSPLERELRRMEILARREQLRVVGRILPRLTERRRLSTPERARPGH